MSSADLVYGWDQQLFYVFVNPAGAAILEKEPAELLGTAWPASEQVRLADPDFPDKVKRVFETGEVHREQLRFVGPDGPRYYEYALSLFHGVAQALVISVTRDITEAKRLEQIQTDPRASIYGMFMHSPSAVAVFRGPRHLVEFANPTFLAMLGQAEGVLGQPLFEAIPDARTQGFEAVMDRVLRTGEPFVGRELPGHLPRGGRFEGRAFNFLYSPLHGPNDSPDGVAVFAFEAKEAPAGVAGMTAPEARLHFLSEAMPQLLWTAGPDGALDFVNRRWLDYTGRDTLAEGLGAVVHPEDFPATLAQWTKSVDQAETFEAHYRLRGASGNYRWFLGRSIPVKGADGQVRQWVGTATDIDDLKRSAEFRDRVIGITGHDLRNPLATIVLSVKMLLKREDLPADVLSGLKRINRGADQMSRLISDVLDYKLQGQFGGGLPVTPHPCRLDALAREVVEQFRVSHPDRGLSLVAKEVSGARDANRLEQALINLVGNALQHSPPGTPVEVQVGVEGGESFVAVRNGGEPIPEGFIPDLFKPFSRVSKSGRGSLGLGLYIVEEIVHRHGGRIEVRSTAAEGTTFTLRLPLASR